MRLEFESLKVRNFQSISEGEFHFTPGRHLVLGENATDSANSNGSGKSSLFENILWTLFKYTVRDRDPSKNWAGDCVTEVCFRKGGHHYRVERFHKHPKRGNAVDLYVDGERVTTRKTQGTEEDLQRTLGISAEIFASSVVVLQGLPITFSALTPTVRKSVVEELLSFSLWDQIRNRFSGALREYSLQKNTLDSQLQASEREVLQLESKLETLSRVREEMTSELEGQIASAKVRVRELAARGEEISDRIAGRRSRDLRDQASLRSTAVSQCNSRVSSLGVIVAEGLCPECGQFYPPDRIETAKDELRRLKQKVSLLLEEVETLTREASEVEQWETQRSQASTLQTQAEAEVRQLTQKYINSSSGGDGLESVQLLLEESKRGAEALRGDLGRVNHLVDCVDFVQKSLLPSSRFRTEVLEKYLEFLNSILTVVSPQVFSGVSVKLEIDSKGQGIEVSISKRGKPASYRSLSGGEKRRLDIIIVLAFQRYLLESSGISTNLLVFDEIFDGLDSQGVDSVLNCVEGLFPETSSVYVITHKAEVKTRFDSVVKVVKENDNTKWTLGY